MNTAIEEVGGEVFDPEYFNQQMGRLHATMADHGFGLYSEGAPGTTLGTTEAVFDYRCAGPILSRYDEKKWRPEHTPPQRSSAAIYAFAEAPGGASAVLDVGEPRRRRTAARSTWR